MESLLLFQFFGPEMFVILFAILLLFGGKKIPELMRGLGKGIREFNAARSTIEQELKEGMQESEKKKLEETKEKKDA
jgi:sec-independent protein translocase protein TatA